MAKHFLVGLSCCLEWLKEGRTGSEKVGREEKTKRKTTARII